MYQAYIHNFQVLPTESLVGSDARRTKTSLNRSPYRLIHFINIDGSLTKSKYPGIQRIYFPVALASLISPTTHQCWENGSANTGTRSAYTGTYSETFLSILHYFLRVVFKVKYVGLVHYGFVILRRNYSQLILEHIICRFYWETCWKR